MKTRDEITEDDHGHISITGSQGDENEPLDPSEILEWLELDVAAMEALIEHEAKEAAAPVDAGVERAFADQRGGLEMSKQRETFEVWAIEQGIPLVMSKCLTLDELRPTLLAWKAWQASRAAAHECLQGELVEALREIVEHDDSWESMTDIQRMECAHEFQSKFLALKESARAVLARVKEQS